MSKSFDEIIALHSPTVTTADDAWQCGPGWLSIFAGFLEAAVPIARAAGGTIHVRYAKEKMGALNMAPQFRCKPANAAAADTLFDLENRAARQSLSVCEDCGKPGKRRETPFGWLYVSCDDHVRK